MRMHAGTRYDGLDSSVGVGRSRSRRPASRNTAPSLIFGIAGDDAPPGAEAPGFDRGSFRSRIAMTGMASAGLLQQLQNEILEAVVRDAPLKTIA